VTLTDRWSLSCVAWLHTHRSVDQRSISGQYGGIRIHRSESYAVSGLDAIAGTANGIVCVVMDRYPAARRRWQIISGNLLLVLDY
jgi:hypothetical protein